MRVKGSGEGYLHTPKTGLTELIVVAYLESMTAGEEGEAGVWLIFCTAAIETSGYR